MFITILEVLLPTLLLGHTRLSKSEKVSHLNTLLCIGAPHLLRTLEYVLDNVWEYIYEIREKF